MAIKMLITDAGLAEVVNAEQSGTAPVVLSHIAFGTGQYTPTADMTALKSEFKRFDSIKGGAIADNVIHISVHDTDKQAYTVYEVGVFTESGTLFAVSSQTTPIVQKAEDAEVMLVTDFVLSDIDVDSITIGDTNFILNPATTETAGIVELATEAEAKAGTDESRAITPATLDATIEAHDNIVHKSGNETIDGPKTLTQQLNVKSTSLDCTVTPSSSVYRSMVCATDKNNVPTGFVRNWFGLDGIITTDLQVTRPVDGVTKYGEMGVRMYPDGKVITYAPTPDAGDNSTKIATTAFVNTKAGNYLPLAGGKMSGSIYQNNDTRRFIVGGGSTYDSGAHITLDGKSYTDGTHNNGSFTLVAHDGTNNGTLIGQPNGSLTWEEKNIVRSVNGNGADSAGNITAEQTGCLPVSGGAMKATKAMTRDVNNSFLGLHGGTGENNDGAQLYLCGSNHSSSPSSFQLHARNSSTDKVLEGKIDGTLDWDGKHVLNNSFQMPTDGGAVMLTAGTSSAGGAYFRLYGKEHSSGEGQFVLATTDGESTNALVGKPDGSLTWNGNNVVIDPGITALTATSGTVSLAVNKMYTVSVSETTTFSLPTPTDKTVFNQIKVMMKVTGTPTIDWGTTNFFNKATPEIEEGSYDVYFDYDNLLGAWVCGVMAKGAAE